MDKRFMGIMTLGFVWLYGTSAWALSTEQVLSLKKAGISDQTIQLMIQQEMASRENPQDHVGMREIKDKDGNTIIIYTVEAGSGNTDQSEPEKLDKAWNMLQHIIIDGRK